ncbi:MULTISPECIES: glycosyltransferase [Microbacterium]|uniref:D-inositol 3-phosphate glycosyltransferase n=1 Tax=Microbacterium saccharophilum TaxID=1213358 RepID=A0A7Z7GE61_9MICO|nr:MULTISPECIES: glycosyltransferase [Microbacterium]SFI64524.1 Glycosyl transferases group 1 [Microbacterium saccharophilum]
MTATLHVVLDQVTAPTEPDLATASREIARELVRTAPAGCEVVAVVPAGTDVAAVLEREVPGVADIIRTALPRRELAAAWQLGVSSGAPGGMVHSPTSMAPLVKHDRVHDHDQTVLTLWDLAAWEQPHELPKMTVAWHRGMLRRAVKHADAVVVPTHALGERLAEIARLGDRIRVIPGAAPVGFSAPIDDVGRRRSLGLPGGSLVVAGGAAPSARLDTAFSAIAEAGSDLPVVVLDVPVGDEPAVADLAAAAGLQPGRVVVLGPLETADRAAVLAGAVALLAPRTDSAFPWRVMEALALGVPLVAADSAVHREIVLDGGLLAAAGGLSASLAAALASTDAVERLAILSGDRGRAFSWTGAAERVWQLHADL